MITNLVFDRNVVDIYCPLGNPAQGDWRPWYISTGAGTVFRRNRWTIRYYTTNSGGTAWRLRDQTHNVTWDGDSLIVMGNNGVIQMSSQSGGSVQSDQHDNVWKNCFFDNQSTASAYPPFNFQWGMVNVTLQRNVFKSALSTSGEILDVGDIQGTSNVIDHNTFVSFDPNCTPLTVVPSNWGATSSLTVTNNISYLPGTGTGGSNQAGAVIDVWANRTFNLNNNLYVYYGKNSTPGDRAVRFRYTAAPDAPATSTRPPGPAASSPSSPGRTRHRSTGARCSWTAPGPASTPPSTRAPSRSGGVRVVLILAPSLSPGSTSRPRLRSGAHGVAGHGPKRRAELDSLR